MNFSRDGQVSVTTITADQSTATQSKATQRIPTPNTLAGVLLLDKPAGISSAQAVAKVKRALGLVGRDSRIGHAGTLDPQATGLLVVLVGKATRLASFAESGTKKYEIEILLGKTTTTDDIWGDVLTEHPVTVSINQIQAALHSFTGVLEQIPPQVSAVNIEGERAYQRVRRGERVSISPRKVNIFSIEQASIQTPRVRAVVTCSKGTYMRSLARDLGELLGCGGCLSSIRRLASAPFHVDNALPLESVTIERLLPWSVLFPAVRHLALADEVVDLLLHGNSRGLAFLNQEYPLISMGRFGAAPGEESELSQLHEVAGAYRPYAVYSRAADNRPLGLLQGTDGGWSFAVNVG